MFAIRCYKGALSVEWLVDAGLGDRGPDWFSTSPKEGQFWTTREGAQRAIDYIPSRLQAQAGVHTVEIVEFKIAD